MFRAWRLPDRRQGFATGSRPVDRRGIALLNEVRLQRSRRDLLCPELDSPEYQVCGDPHEHSTGRRQVVCFCTAFSRPYTLSNVNLTKTATSWSRLTESSRFESREAKNHGERSHLMDRGRTGTRCKILFHYEIQTSVAPDFSIDPNPDCRSVRRTAVG